MRTSQISINYYLILKIQHPNGHHCMILVMHMKSSTLILLHLQLECAKPLNNLRLIDLIIICKQISQKN
jgi:hypothetical protein